MLSVQAGFQLLDRNGGLLPALVDELLEGGVATEN